jgi:hypothetical protein
MVRAWQEEGYDVVEGVKQARGSEPMLRRGQARLFYSLLRRLGGIDLRNASDFKLLDRKVLDAWTAMPERNVFFRGMSAWLGFRRKQIPFEVAPRAAGSSGWSAMRRAQLAARGITGTGAPGIVNSIVVTASGLVFGAGHDNQIRAWDSDTGQQLWSSRFGGGFLGSPFMYETSGRTFLVVPAASSAGGGRGTPPPAPLADGEAAGPMGWVAYSLPR